jgi:hypothetical protein
MASKILVQLVGDSRSLERSFKRANSSAKGFNKNMTGVGRASKKGQGAMRGVGRAAGLAGGFLGVAGLAGAARASFGEMSQSAKVTAQTNAVIKSTGGVAKVSAKHVENLGDSLLAKSGVDDETIRSGENMLLTFRGIRNEAGKGNKIFDKAAAAVLDMDVAMSKGNVTQESLSKKAIIVGKALQDPVRGLTALRRVGVQFTKGQEAQIKAMVESGDVVGAQKMILRELNTEFGGSAAALGQTLPGKINIARESFRNLGGTLATQLVPALTRGVDSLNKFLSNAKNQKAIVDGFKTAVAAVSGVLRVMRTVFQTLSGAVGGSKNAIKLLIGVFILFKAVKMASAVAGVATQFGILGTKAGTAGGKMRGARGGAGALRGSLIGKAGLVGAVLAAGFVLSKLIRKIPGWEGAMKSFGGAIEEVAEKLGLVNDPLKEFEGKKDVTQTLAKQLRTRALTLHNKGLSDVQVQQRLARENPKVALHDIKSLTTRFLATRKDPPIVTHVHVHLDKEKVGTVVTEAQRKARKRNTTQRRGRIGGP